MDTSNIIKAIVGKGNYSVTSPITQWDYGYILQIEGIELPITYEVDFSNTRYDGEALTAYGNAEGVEVPEELIETGRDIYAFYYYIGANHGKTTYTWKIPNELRAKRGEKHPTPSQQDSVDQAVAILNKAAAKAEQNAENAERDAGRAEAAVEHYPKIVNKYWYIWDAENEVWIDTGLKAESVDGIDGVSPTVTVTNSSSTGVHTIKVTDKDGTKTATIYDGLTVTMLNSSFTIPTDANGVLLSNTTLRASFNVRKGSAYINGSINSFRTVALVDPNNLSHVEYRSWSYCAATENPYTEISLPAGYKMRDGNSGAFTITLNADGKEFTFTPAWAISKQGPQGIQGDKGDPGERGPKGDPGEPALGMDIHICTSSEYDATTRVPMINDPDEHTFYLVPSAEAASPDLFVEWIYMNNSWEKFGSASIALKRIKDDPSENGGVIEGDFYSVRATGLFSHAEGISTNASGLEAHAEGAGTTASGNYSHSEGGGTKATADQSHAEGAATTASGNSSHAEGGGTTASGLNAHAEGNGTKATDREAHAEGFGTTASGYYSHAEGDETTAEGQASHSSGTYTIAKRKSQFVIGEFNVGDTSGSDGHSRGDYIFIAGNGSDTLHRSNAMALDWNGNEKLSGGLTLGMGTNDETSLSASELKAMKAGGSSSEDIEQLKNDVSSIKENLNDKAPVIIESASGSIASFSDGADDMPLKSLVVDIDPVQDLHGQDAPYPAGGGKNKAGDFETGSFSESSAVGSAYANMKSSSTTRFRTANVIQTNGSQFTVSADFTNYMVCMLMFDANQQYIGKTDGFREWSTSNFTYARTSIYYVALAVKRTDEGTISESDMTNCKLQLEFSDSATAYAPYSNICPISGWTGVKAQRTGKNLYDGTLLNGYYDATNGGVFVSSANWRATNKMRCKSSTTYVMSGTSYSGGSYNGQSLFWDINGNYLGTRGTGANFTSYANSAYMALYFGHKYVTDAIQIEEGSTATAYSPYNGNTYTISWQSEAGTVYGGTLDVVSGELVVDRAMVDLGTLNWVVFDANTSLFSTNDLVNNKSTNSGAISSMYPITSQGFAAMDDKTMRGTVSDLTLWVIRDTAYTDAASFKTAISGVQLVYELATPITYHLTPTEVKSLLGTNNVWADTGDVEVEYRANTKLWVQKKITEAVAAALNS